MNRHAEEAAQRQRKCSNKSGDDQPGSSRLMDSSLSCSELQKAVRQSCTITVKACRCDECTATFGAAYRGNCLHDKIEKPSERKHKVHKGSTDMTPPCLDVMALKFLLE